MSLSQFLDPDPLIFSLGIRTQKESVHSMSAHIFTNVREESLEHPE